MKVRIAPYSDSSHSVHNGSTKESKHIFKVNVSKPQNDLYPQFREWHWIIYITDAWRQCSINHALTFGKDGWQSTSWESSVGTTQMNESAQPGKRHILFICPIASDVVVRTAEVKSNSETMIRQVAKIAFLKEDAAWKMVYPFQRMGTNTEPAMFRPLKVIPFSCKSMV